MKLNLRALSIACGILTGAAILIVGIANIAWNGYGIKFLEIMASVYPGYDASGSIGDMIVGTLYGVVDGLVFGWVFGWLYNRFTVVRVSPETRQQPIEP
jgi:hypothetical protein